MNWASWSDFFAMGGYATYVWGSYLVTFAIMALEIVLLRQRRRSAQDKMNGYLNRKINRKARQDNETPT